MKNINSRLKRGLSLIIVLAMVLTFLPVLTFAADSTTTVYLDPGLDADQNPIWDQAGAWFAAWAWQTGSAGSWFTLADKDADGIYEAELPTGYSNVIFVRMADTATEPNWDDDNKWNQTNDLTISGNHNLYTITGWGGADGAWSHYDGPTYSVAGSPGWFETAWVPGMYCMADDDGDGIYTYVVENVDAGWYEFKICVNGEWTHHYPSENAGLTVEQDGSTVTICFDPASRSVTYTVTAPETTRKLYLQPGVGAADNAWFAVYAFEPTDNSVPGNQWYTMTKGSEYYEAEIDLDYTKVIFCRMNPTSSDLSWSNKWNQTNDLVLGENNLYTITGYNGDILEGTWSTYTPQPSNPSVADCTVTLHFENSANWGAVALYAWDGTQTRLTDAWPGVKLSQGSDNFYTYTLTVPSGTVLNYIFNNNDGGEQTVDLSLGTITSDTEKWVRLTGNSDGKYTAEALDSAFTVVNSPVVDGTSVTFHYAGDATGVKVYGSWNNWGSATTMTRNGDVWSATLSELDPGQYEYKFVVDDTWITDPANAWVNNGNSAFMILNPNAVDNNDITVRIHYTRSDGNYDGWNMYLYNDAGTLKATSTALSDTELLTTVHFADARSVLNLNVIPRHSTETNDWASQEATCYIDLSNIVSGTVDYYITSGTSGGVRVLNDDTCLGHKLSSVQLDYDKNTVSVTLATPVTNPNLALQGISGTMTEENGTYVFTLSDTVVLSRLYQYSVTFEGYSYAIDYTPAYASDKFADQYTYTGDDLGANWTSTGTTFRLWAPTATGVSVNLYIDGTDGVEDLICQEKMTADVNGTWVVTVDGDLNGVYYTYSVTRDGETVEAVDPYARTTGVNGNRGMVIDLDSTDPEGWEQDKNPNPSTSYTDAIIYELHIRDFSADSTSGIIEDYQGKFLALTQTGTTVNGTGDISTGIDYLKALGITHVHLLPVYDYASVDETTCTGYNWGYDPLNYNVPEGSYSTDPYKGEVRVSEFKQMVMALHDAGISVIMDVVYNHVYNADTFCMNTIVPYYFSRQNSNGSGCGNDTASEREMVQKFIVESVYYWMEEYHIDGFRFDLVGLLDTETINMLVDKVHATRKDVIFYGEGWTMSTNAEAGTTMATQQNSAQTPNFGYFSDTMRDLLAGNNGNSLGFVSGATGKESALLSNFMANAGWSSNPSQIVQYVSCHDNYTLVDKLIKSTGAVGITDAVISMNNLAAAIYLTAQGIPFIHAGEEILREKLNEDGSRNHNSYNSSDFVNAIRWDHLETEEYADTLAYYQGLIAFRKAHSALRMSTSAQISENIQATVVGSNVVAFLIDGNATGDDDIFVIFNANSSAVSVSLPDGVWSVCVDKDHAGTDALYTAEVSAQVAGISAMVLTRPDTGKNADSTTTGTGSNTVTVYFSNNKNWSDVHAYAFGTSGDLTSGWPGNAMTYVETNGYGEDIYSITISADATGLIFNGSGGQTVDITDISDGMGYYCTDQSDGKYKVGTYTYGSSSATVGGFTNSGVYSSYGDYYLFGWIDGDNYGCESCYEAMGAYKFDENGHLTVCFDKDSYVGVKTTGNRAWFMTDGWLGSVTSATLYNSDNLGSDANKLLIPGGVEIGLTLTENTDGTLNLRYQVKNDNTVTDLTGIQNGVTLHCWNWSFSEIQKNMAQIAEMGFTAIQTSPIQPVKEATTDATDTVEGCWWLYYQPVDFSITDDEGNVLGTKADLIDMIDTAHAYGIAVIVDVVTNHMANETGNDLSSAIAEDLRNNLKLWHDITTNVTDYSNRYQSTQLCVGGLPDLNTASETIQGYVLNFLKECIDIGVDGFRFDAAKHIETDSDELAYESDFWNVVIGGAKKYASETYDKDVYVYGEVLDTISVPIADYTKYMSVTDNSWGNTLRNNIVSGLAALADGYDKAANADDLVIWAESHDTYADGISSDVSTADINKTWALVAARADAMGLYLARPESNSQLLGVASVTGWANDEVKAVNKFHNLFIGASEKVSNEGNISYVERGNSGAVLVNVSGTTATVQVTAHTLRDGIYADQLTGNIFTVTNGKLSGNIGDTGIAVLYQMYTVTVADTEGGVAEVDKETAAVGETVTITVSPDADQQISGLTVVNSDGNPISVVDNGDGTYSFKMPGDDVIVRAVFEEIPDEPDGDETLPTLPGDDDDVQPPEDDNKGDDDDNAKVGDYLNGFAFVALLLSLLMITVLVTDHRRKFIEK